jgi:hypothetical protein
MNQKPETIALAVVVLLFVGCLVGWVTFRVFGDAPPDIPGGTAAAYGALLGLPAVGVALYKWAHGRE